MPSQVLSAFLFAHDPKDLEARHGPEPDQDSIHRQFIILGRFDRLVLRLSAKMQEMLPERSLAANARGASGCAYLGHVLGERCQLEEWTRTHPLIGFCSLRFARRALTGAGNFDFLGNFLKKELTEDIRWTVVSSTGWEDALVIFFGRSFNAIKKAIGQLRGLHADNSGLPKATDRTDGFHHLVLTSCTLPGIALDGWRQDWTHEQTIDLLKHLEADEKLRWAVRVEIHPGHWGAFTRLLEERSREAGLEVDVTPLFGQADLRVTPKNWELHGTHGGLITFLTEVMFKLECTKDTVVRTVQTRLTPMIEGYEEDPEAGPHSTRHCQADAGAMLETYCSRSKLELASMGAPPHTLNALEETLSRIQGMAGDRLHGEEFSAIRALADSFVRATERVLPPENHAAFEHEARELLRDISDWQAHVERCLADRFRGPYPAGDSLMVRLGSHPGAHHRFLVTMDHFAQQAYVLARTCINKRIGWAMLPEITLATYIGNSPTAYAMGHMIRRLRCGFTDVPANMVGRMRDLHVVAHETGHHLFRAFCCSFKGFDLKDSAESSLRHHLEKVEKMSEAEARMQAKKRAEDGLVRDVKEILADLFAYHFCFLGDPAAYENAAYQTIRSYYQDAPRSKVFMRSVLTEITLRQYALQCLVQHVQEDQLPSYDQKTQQYLHKLPGAGAGPEFTRLRERIAAMRAALGTLLVLQLVPQFKALMTGLLDCEKTESFPGEAADESFLKTLRGFLASPASEDDADNLKFLDHLWFTALKTQPTLLS